MSRLSSGGRIDRDSTLRFSFDGTEFSGHPGDTLASALLAADRIEVGPSIYQRRPRGIYTADATEPNALVQLLGHDAEPLVPAPMVELADGLVAESLSGVGRLPRDAEARKAIYDKKYVHADVVVVGAGPAGLAAALAAGRSGARVILVEQWRELGGTLLDGAARIGGGAAQEWIASAAREFVDMQEIRVLTRATVVGHYEHNYLLIAQRRATGQPRQRLWHVRAKRVALATGAHERPLVFAGNDRPGVMLASAVRSYLHRYAVLPGQEAVVFTTSDSAYATALDLLAAGARVTALVDTRPRPPARLAERVRAAGAAVYAGSAVVETSGEHRVSSVVVSDLDSRGAFPRSVVDVPCDLLAVCGGWNPVLDLFSQAGGTLRWDPAVAGFVPRSDGGRSPKVVGAARGTYDLAGCLAQGFAAGAEAATDCGFRTAMPSVPAVHGDRPPARSSPLWIVPVRPCTRQDERTHFVDLQRDATVADVRRAVGAGMRSVEHIKRYTTIGTGPDQGKTSAVAAAGVIAEVLGRSPGEVATTTARPPYQPVPFALLAGRDAELRDPVRTTPMHSWHVAAGARFENVGQWKRPWYYPGPGEDMDAAVRRECIAARTGVAMMDATTLGKIEIVGPDAGTFLNRIYTNGFAKLPVGKARYGMMCKADGMVFDDGVTMRLADDRYLMSTTTGNAAAVLDWLEEWLQTEWPDLAVHCTSVTEQWATIAVAGPDSRAVLARVAPHLDVSAAGFGFMEFRETVLCNGIPARICRISFSGELAFEINVESWHGLAVWESVVDAGADYQITPYGTETMHVLRAEKGFVIVGQDTDGTVTPYDLGMEWVVSDRKDCIGKRSFARPDTARGDRKQLVGLLPVDPDQRLPEGAQLVEPALAEPPGVQHGASLRQPVPMLGHVTSSYRSAVLDRTFALALVKDGRRRIGDVLHVPWDGHSVAVLVTKPVFYDEEGARRDGRPH